VESLLSVVIDRGPQIFKVAPRPTSIAPMLGVCPTIHAIDGGKHFTAPPTCKSRNAFIKLLFVGLGSSGWMLSLAAMGVSMNSFLCSDRHR
jgi:hypothetical protein